MAIYQRTYPNVSIRKAKISSDSCRSNEYNQYKKINSHVQLFRTFNSIWFHVSVTVMSLIQQRREVHNMPIFWTMVLQWLFLALSSWCNRFLVFSTNIEGLKNICCSIFSQLYLSELTCRMDISFNSFMTEAVIIKKPVHWFAPQNQWTGFYMTTASVMKEFRIFLRIFLDSF